MLERPPPCAIELTMVRSAKSLTDSADSNALLEVHSLCEGTGWICEEHPWLQFGHDDCPGPGIPCRCNPREEVQWKSICCGGSELDHAMELDPAQ
jgi:hypothetical protein